jgi:hypothetical protein
MERLEIQDAKGSHEVKGYLDGRVWFYEDGTPIETGSTVVTMIKGYRDNPSIRLSDPGVLYTEQGVNGWYAMPGKEPVTGLPQGPFSSEEAAKAHLHEMLEMEKGRLRPPGVSLNPASEKFQDGAAKAFWTDLYINEIENLREDGYGELAHRLSAGDDWMAVAPEVPEAAKEDAEAFQKQVLEANDVGSIEDLAKKAAEAEDLDPDELDIELFGHYLAMESLGHSVSWFDEHAEFDLMIPEWEVDHSVSDAMGEYIDRQKEENE